MGPGLRRVGAWGESRRFPPLNVPREGGAIDAIEAWTIELAHFSSRGEGMWRVWCVPERSGSAFLRRAHRWLGRGAGVEEGESGEDRADDLEDHGGADGDGKDFLRLRWKRLCGEKAHADGDTGLGQQREAGPVLLDRAQAGQGSRRSASRSSGGAS